MSSSFLDIHRSPGEDIKSVSSDDVQDSSGDAEGSSEAKEGASESGDEGAESDSSKTEARGSSFGDVDSGKLSLEGSPGVSLGEAEGQISVSDAVSEMVGESSGMSDFVEVLEDSLVDDMVKELRSPLHLERNAKGRPSLFPPYPGLRDRIFVPPRSEDYEYYMEVKEEAADNIRVLQRGLNFFLRTKTEVRWSKGLEEGVVDVSELHRLVGVKDPRVMQERRSVLAIDTAILLLVDASGSMPGVKTTQMMIVLNEALSSVPWLKLAVASFTTSRSNRGNPVYGPYGRADPLELVLLRDFDTPLKKARASLGGFEIMGFTPTGESYGYALERLSVRREKRKVLWIVTDGWPQVNAIHPDHSEQLLVDMMYTRAKRWGIEVIGTCIQTSWAPENKVFAHSVDYSSKVYETSELPAAIVAMLKDVVKAS